MKIAFSRKALLFVVLLFGSIGAFAQTKGLIYQASTSATIRAVLDPNGDGYTSKTNTGFSGTNDYGSTHSELSLVSLPVLSGETSGDVVTGGTGGHTDLCSNSGTQSVAVAVTTVNGVQYLVARFRIGRASTASKGYSLLIDSDATFGTFLTSNNPGYDREVILETGNPGSVKIYSHTASGTTTLATYSAAEYSQRSAAATTNDSDADYFYDFCVPLSAVNASGFIRITAATITSAQSGIGGTVSDFNGINDAAYSNPFQAMKDIIYSFPSTVRFTDIVDGYTFPALVSTPPVITSTVSTISTTISGTSTEANGTSVQVFKNGSALGSAVSVSANAWTLNSGVSGLVAGDIITAKATATGKGQSSASNSVEVTSQTCFTPAPVVTDPRPGGGGQNLTGTWRYADGSFPAAGTVLLKLYQQTADNTFLLISTTAQYVAADGTFTFNTGLTNTDYNNYSLVLTATVSSCESTKSNVSKKTNGSVNTIGAVSATPTMVTSQIIASTSIARSVQVTNTDANAANLLLYINGNQVAITASTVASGSTHTFNYTGFIEGDIVTARAQVPSSTTSYWLSAPSSSVTVTADASTSSTPVITGSYFSGSGKTVSGYCNENAGTTIYLYKAGSTLLGTTTVNAYGGWSITGLTLAASDVLTAKADATGKLLSAASTGVTVSTSAPSAPTITTASIIVGVTSSVAGTGGSGTVVLYAGGEEIGSVASAGAWSISPAAAAMYKGARITARNRDANGLTSAESNAVTVSGINSFSVTATGGGNIGTQTAGTAFNVAITALDAGPVTFTTYTSSNTIFSASTISSGSTTSNFTAGVLASHSITLTTAGTYTLQTLNASDPTVVGTSNSFTVNPAAANKLRVNTQPSVQNNVNSSFGTQPIVHITDTYNNLRSADGGSDVTATILSGTSGAVLSGTTTRSVTAGVATFDDLKIDKPGEYILRFTSSAGLTQVDSDPIYVGRVWRGSNSNDYNTSGNWSNSTIPSTDDDIAFAQTPTNDLYLDADRVITNYYNYSTNTKKLIVNGKKLTIKGSINHGTNSIDASLTNSEVEFGGSSAQAIAANTFVSNSAYKIKINNSAGVALNGALAITGELAPSAGVFATNNNLTLKSTSVTNTAVVSAGSTSGGYITGEVTVERFIPARRAYRLITSPVTTSGSSLKPYIRDNWQEGTNNTAAGIVNNQNPNPGYGTHISGVPGSAAGFDVTASTNNSLFIWNAGTQGWNAVANTNATTITAGSTYRLMIRGDRSIDYSTNTPTPTNTILRTTGTLAQGNQNAVSLSSTLNAWNLIGNPYQSQVDMSTVTKSNLKTFYYVWDPQRGTRGAWVTFDFTTGTSDNGSAVNKYAQPGQSFFMQTLAAGAASITFNESHKDNSSAFTAVHRTGSSFTKLFVSLNYTDTLAVNGRSADGFMVAFDPSFSNSNTDDIPKLSNMDENFSIQRSGELLAHEKRVMPVVNDSIQIYINQYTSQQYTIRLQWENPVAGAVAAFLVDTYTNVEYPISASGHTDVNFTINTSVAATTNPKRFVIVFKNTGPLPVSGIEIAAVKGNNSVQVKWTALNEQKIKQYEVEESADGVSFTKGATVAALNNTAVAQYQWLDQLVQQGANYYRVKAIGEDGQYRYTAVVKVQMNGSAAQAVVSPNPATNHQLQLQLNDFTQGKLQLTVTDALGRSYLSQAIQHNGNSSSHLLKLPQQMTAGVYFIRIAAANLVETISFQVK